MRVANELLIASRTAAHVTLLVLDFGEGTHGGLIAPAGIRRCFALDHACVGLLMKPPAYRMERTKQGG